MLLLVIVKKAAKLLILLVVLLFLPQLQQLIANFSDNFFAKTLTKEGFAFIGINGTTYDEQSQLSDLQFFFQSAIESFAIKNLVCPGDDDLHCRLSYMFDQIDVYFPYYRIPEIISGTSTTAAPTLNLWDLATTTPKQNDSSRR